MMQMGDDIHILAQAATDMRNLTYALSFFMLVGMVMFLALKCFQDRRRRSRRRRRLQNVTYLDDWPIYNFPSFSISIANGLR